MGFEDKVVLITGGTSGIGKQIAESFLAEQAKVVITGRDKRKGTQCVSQLRPISDDIIFIQADTSKVDDVKRQTNESIQHFGKLDVLIPNAGLNHVGKLSDTSESAWDTIMDTNLKGVFLTIKMALPYLKETQGSIVTIGSDVALRGSTSIPVYSISKAGVWMLTRLLAAELAEYGIRVNCVLPANVAPGMRHTLIENPEGVKWIPEDPEGEDWVVPPTGRFGTTKEVANVVLFLASNKASYCSGSGVLIDGALNAAQP